MRRSPETAGISAAPYPASRNDASAAASSTSPIPVLRCAGSRPNGPKIPTPGCARGLRFHWLRRWRAHPGVGIFGPFGLLPAHRKTGIGEVLLAAALASLREAGYGAALIPAVSGDRLIASYAARTGAAVVDEFAFLPERTYRTAILASGARTRSS